MVGDESACEAPRPQRPSLRRFLPLALILVLSAVILLTGWHRQLSFEALVRHYAAVRAFIAAHEPTAVLAYIILYVGVVALSLPVGLYFTLIGGALFGAALGGAAALIGATGGAVAIFLIARSAFGEQLVCRAGARVRALADGFRADAFHYLLFLRLVPVIPFWLTNLVGALAGLRLSTFAAATALGIIPATLAFAFVGAGLDSAIAAQEAAYRACLAQGHADCRLEFHPEMAITPELLAGLAALGVIALIPVLARRWRAVRSTAIASGHRRPCAGDPGKEGTCPPDRDCRDKPGNDNG